MKWLDLDVQTYEGFKVMPLVARIHGPMQVHKLNHDTLQRVGHDLGPAQTLEQFTILVGALHTQPSSVAVFWQAYKMI